jgi:hypothetical protein
MRVATMKSIHGGNSPLLRTATISSVPGHYRSFDDLKERAKDVATLSAVAAVIIVLYAVMFVALCRWSRYAPVFPDGGAGSTTTEQIPYGSE